MMSKSPLGLTPTQHDGGAFLRVIFVEMSFTKNVSCGQAFAGSDSNNDPGQMEIMGTGHS